MSDELRTLENGRLVCEACGHIWTGLWNMGSSMQCDAVRQCVACGKLAAKSLQSLGLFPENAFRVAVDPDGDGESVRFSLPAEGRDFIAPYAFTVRLPAKASLTLAAWLAKAADPSGKLFAILYGEVTGRNVTGEVEPQNTQNTQRL